MVALFNTIFFPASSVYRAPLQMRGSMASLWNRMRSSVLGHEIGDEEREGIVGSSTSIDRRDEEGTPTRSVSTDYTELMGGSVPCPSCKGTGRIPKEMEETLVALIPINDERLQPKHTWRWVVAVVIVCLLIASGIIFMLMPRPVELHSNLHPVNQVYDVNSTLIPDPKDPSKKIKVLSFHFMNHVNISNANYYTIQVLGINTTVVSKFQPWNTNVLGHGGNTTTTTVLPLNGGRMEQLAFNNSVILSDVAAEYCTASFSRLTSLYISMQFDILVFLSYFNHKEQISTSVVQQVCCVPSGNCTSPY